MARVKAGRLSQPEDARAPMPGQPRRYTVTVHEGFEQGDPEWHEVRLGRVTASNFSAIMVQKDESEMRRKLLRRLAAERITGEPSETFTNAAMERGKAMEEAARQHYEQTRLVDLHRVAFVDNGVAGCSPDSLIGTDGGLEIKTMRPDLMIPLLEQPATMPAAHRAQVHGGMWVCQRAWWDFKIFWPRMPDFTVRIQRDEAYIKQLADAVEVFNYDLEKLVDKIRKMGA